jgi:tetratricopeptide (TPR) repeat protein
LGESVRVRREWWIGLLLAVVTLAVYWPVRTCDFLDFDDDYYVTQNAHVQLGLTGEALRWAFTTGWQGNWHPLTWISHIIDYRVYGSNATGHHFTSLLLHAANSVLLFGVLRLMTGAVWRSALVAGLFAWHPMHVESVAWVAERKDVLSTFFGLLALGMYGRYAAIQNYKLEIQNEGTEAKAGSGALWYYGAAVVFYGMSLMSKSMLVTLPFVMLLLDYWPLRRSEKWRVMSGGPSAEVGQTAGVTGVVERAPINATGIRRWSAGAWGGLILEKAPFFGLAAGCCVVTMLLQRHAGAVASEFWLPMDARMMNAVAAYLGYTAKLLWPQGLCILYPMPHEWPMRLMLPGVLYLICGAVLVVKWGRALPYLAVGWLWFIGTLVPVIGLVQVGNQYMADRYSYIPSVGLFVAVAWGLGDLATRVSAAKPVLAVLACGCLGLCLWRTHVQLQYWRDSVTVFEHTVSVTKNNPVALCNLAVALTAQGKFEEAIARAQEAQEIDPRVTSAEAAMAYAYSGEHKMSAAAEHYRKALALDPGFTSAMNNLALILSTDPDAANRDGAEAVRLAEGACDRSDHIEPLFLGTLATAYAEVGRFDDAIAANNRACEMAEAAGKYDLATAFRSRSHYYATHKPFRNEVDPAVDECKAAMEAEARGESAAALQDYRKALEINPDLVPALNNLAWDLATDADGRKRDGAEAVRLAERACELTGRHEPYYIGTLAAAYAEAGRFNEAVAAGNEARRLYLAAGRKDMAETNRIFAQEYQAHRAYHEALNATGSEGSGALKQTNSSPAGGPAGTARSQP